jgi:MFS family permease
LHGHSLTGDPEKGLKQRERNRSPLNPLLAWKDLARLPRPLWYLAAAHFVNRCGTMVVAFLALYFVRHHQLSLPIAGGLVACYSWGSLAAAPAAAWLCARWDAVNVLTFSLASAGLCMFCVPWVHGIAAWAALCFVLGLLSELSRPAGYTALGRLAPAPQLRQAFTLNRVAVNLGMSVGPVVGGLLAQVSYTYLFWVDGLTSLLAASLLVALGLRSGGPAAESSHNQPTRLSPLFFRYLVGHFLGMLVFVQLFVAMPLYIVDRLGMPESSSGWLFSLNTLLVLTLEPWITHISQGWPLPRVIAAGYLAQGLGLGMLGIAPSYTLALVGVSLFTLGEMLQSPASSTYLNALAHGRLLGRANAWFVGCGSVAFIATPPAVGWMLVHWGAQILWYGVGLVGVVSALWMITLPEKPEATASNDLPHRAP